MAEDSNDNVQEPIENYQQPLSFEKVWAMFQEVAQQQKETDRQFKETQREISRMSMMFTSNWGKLMEALIEPSALKLFKSRGIDIQRSYSNVKVESKTLEAEFDIVLANGTEVVVIEVKTTFSTSYVDEFYEKMLRFKEYFPDFSSKTVYAAVAGIKYDQGSDKYALKKGFFIIKSSGEGLLKIANTKSFKPNTF
jgi:hypothetical protein